MRKILTAIVAVLTSLTLTACGLGTAGGFTRSGDLAGELKGIDLSGLNIAVGSKNFTEQIILGKIGAILLESAGANVQDLTNIPGSTSARQALVTGDLDVMFEYTGTAWITYLGNSDPIPDERAQYEAVREADQENGLAWLLPAPMNNTYAMAVTRENSEKYGLTSLEDIATLPEEQQTYCVDAEFNARNDGLVPMLEAYGIPEPPSERRSIMDTGAIYAATDNGTCMFGEVFNTDGRIQALDLVVLDDPRGFFPKYNMAPVVREEVLNEYPEIEELFAPLTEDLDDAQMQELNARADVNGEDYATIAYDYLVSEGWIE